MITVLVRKIDDKIINAFHDVTTVTTSSLRSTHYGFANFSSDVFKVITLTNDPEWGNPEDYKIKIEDEYSNHYSNLTEEALTWIQIQIDAEDFTLIT